MAASRYTAPNRPIQGGRRMTHCPTCGRTRMMHGHRGALQRSGSCSQRCYTTFRQFGLATEFIAAGVSPAYANGIAPPITGGMSI